ncbi:MAG: pimeloyl-[acyl-carrier protein] methyl ester esterase [Methylococcales bacterium]|nr:pimeloyl-[acyl-carrier protein] methyl ester esterase [Methylococcales bacterium]
MLYSDTFGTGKPIILVHGWAMHSGIWRGFAQQLARHYQVTCIDLPAHGRSEKIIPFNLEVVSDALINTLPETPSCWLGWSLGATIALDIAHRYPERVSSLILLAGNPLFVSADAWAGVNPTVLDAFAANLTTNCQATLLRFLALQVNGLPDNKALLKDLKAAIMECEPPDNDSLQGGLDILKHTDLRAVLAQLTVPVSVILGDKDTLVPVAVGQQIQQFLAQLELTILEGAGHVPFLSHAQQLLTLICHFMDKLCP